MQKLPQGPINKNTLKLHSEMIASKRSCSAKRNDPSLFNIDLKQRDWAQNIKCQRTSEEIALMAKGYLQAG